MNRNLHFLCGAAILATAISGCGGSTTEIQSPAVTSIEVLANSQRGIQSIAFNGGKAYLALSNTTTEGTAVRKTSLPLHSTSIWNDVPLGDCALGPSNEYVITRSPTLKQLGDTVWLFQQWSDWPSATPEHSLCALAPQAITFVPHDEGLRACNDIFCETLWMKDLKQVGTRLYTNAGGGHNLLVSDTKAASWRLLRGRFDSSYCSHSAFHVVGDRLLTGGECPLDVAFLEAYQLTADGMGLASQDPIAITVPELENRMVQFIESVAGTQRVFVGVEGGLLRSDDGGRTFKFVIRHPIDTKNYPYVRSFLSPAGKPNVIVVGGFDKVTAKPYLAWSADGGDKWTDLSTMLPGYGRTVNDGKTAEVTSLVQDPQGRILVTLNEEEDTKGVLMVLTLGQP
ncbi:hypothetical protein [Massilia horti]|uniref:Exo-alpha-sialidase n=1 Tax=Massilia horti TaxID=2562153 RepID=A0A4Y9T640_9BURK|nr:hypothetical protein [Massilia horti]TFW32609.1 hypothetical protein E4O92_09295 [Massilia horti]TFW32620.1 hypothetical protein E4O92_09360 [Massilia horti]